MPKSFDFEVSLRGARAKVWRRFLLASTATFYELHEAIPAARDVRPAPTRSGSPAAES